MPFNSFDDYPMNWRPDRESLGKPYYVGLVDLLEESVRAGELPAGAALPPQRELADFLDLNPSTVARAYALARERGLVYGVTGKGTFVAPHAQSDLTITAEGADGLVELGMVTGFNQCDGLVADAVRTVAQRGYLSRLMDYSNPCGYPHHLEAGRRWLAWKGLRREPDCVVVTSGVQNALVVTLCALFRAGDRIAVDAYTFANFIELAKMMGIELVPVAGDADGMRDAALDALCRAVDVRGVYLMPSCANPTTVHMPLERRRRVAAVAERHGLVIVEDDFGGTVERLDLELGRPVTPRFADLAPERTVHVAETTNTLPAVPVGSHRPPGTARRDRGAVPRGRRARLPRRPLPRVGRGEGGLSARVAVHVGEPPAFRARAEGVAQRTRCRGGGGGEARVPF